ncbi:MAG: hypothetical protein ACK4NY_14055 [Spirosomataceae bacterium]
MKRSIFYILLVLSISSCWAPRCPVRSCQVKVEHRHGELKGIFGSKSVIPGQIHFLWDGKKSEKNPNAWDKNPNRKARKKFPWERW